MKTLILSVLLGASAAAPVLADDAVAKRETPVKVKKSDADSGAKGGAAVADRKAAALATQYGVTKDQVLELRNDQKMGWGEIKHALNISKESGKPLADIVALRKSGKGWGQIANDLGVSVSGKGSRGAAESAGAKGSRGSRGAEDPAGPARGGGMGGGHGKGNGHGGR